MVGVGGEYSSAAIAVVLGVVVILAKAILSSIPLCIGCDGAGACRYWSSVVELVPSIGPTGIVLSVRLFGGKLPLSFEADECCDVLGIVSLVVKTSAG